MDNEAFSNLDVFSSLHEPYWIASTSKQEYPSLKVDIDVDIAIIGGGIVGITSAFLLKQEGFRVAIIEANKIAQGTTGHTTAKITSQHNLIYHKIISTMSREKASLYADANESAIQFIASLVKKKNINCDFKWCPAYVYTSSEEYIEKIEDEAMVAASLGIRASFLDSLPLPFDIKAAIRFDNQAQFHPLKYLLTLAEEIPGNGSNIFEDTRVVDIEDGEKCVVKTKDNRITAAKVIVASHFPCYDGLGMYFARMYTEKSYVLGVQIKDSFPEGMFINAEDPGRSLRCQSYNGGNLILVGGEHHKTGHGNNTNVHYENLSSFAKETFDLQSILYRWSTQDCMTVDGIPYVGHLTSKTENIFVATGFGKWGMTNGTASAIILTDLISKRENPWTSVYDPSRFEPLASISNLITQNADVAAKLVGGKLAIVPSDVEIKIGEAKVLNIDGEKVGAYRDEKGILHTVDTTCTHLGCELVWNEAEKTWDCPCHGSRFGFDGENVEGPAFNPLKHQGQGPNKKDPNIF